jgi:hypothetical protein
MLRMEDYSRFFNIVNREIMRAGANASNSVVGKEGDSQHDERQCK